MACAVGTPQAGDQLDLVVEFEAQDATGGVALPPDYNVAPTKNVHAVRPVGRAVGNVEGNGRVLIAAVPAVGPQMLF